MYGSDFGSGFLSSFSSSIVTLATADFQALIGKQGLKEGGFEHAGLHALVGCVAAELSSANCASGAIGGIAQSIYAGNTGVLERHINKDKHLANVEMVSALAAYFTSQGKGENVSIGASIGRSGFENNALCGGLCILAAIAVGGYILGTGEGDPIEGLRRIGRGEDLLSELAGLVGEEALAFATDKFPEQTAAVINAMIAAGEVANVVIQWTDEATGQVVSSTWNDIPQSTRDAIVGGTKVATFLIPAGSAGRILRRVPERTINRGFTSSDEAFDTINDFRGRTTITDANGGTGTVAVTEVNGQKYFGVNSMNLTNADKNLARSWRERLGLTRGQDQVVFHAEAHSLMRADARTGGNLPPNVTLYVDRNSCGTCQTYLPRMAHEMGISNLNLNFASGRSAVIHNGTFEWVN